MKKETEKQIWTTLERATEKWAQERKTDEDCLMLYLVRQHLPKIKQKFTEIAEKFISEEKEKGFVEEDLRFFFERGYHGNEFLSMNGENKISGILLGFGYRGGVFPYFERNKVTKTNLLAARKIKAEFMEKEREARILLKDELKELEELKETTQRQDARIKEMEDIMEAKKIEDKETEEEDVYPGEN